MFTLHLLGYICSVPTSGAMTLDFIKIVRKEKLAFCMLHLTFGSGVVHAGRVSLSMLHHLITSCTGKYFLKIQNQLTDRELIWDVLLFD